MKRLISPSGKPEFVADALVATYLKRGYTEETSESEAPLDPAAPTAGKSESDED